MKSTTVKSIVDYHLAKQSHFEHLEKLNTSRVQMCFFFGKWMMVDVESPTFICLQVAPLLSQLADVHGATAAHWAARNGNLQVLERLKEAQPLGQRSKVVFFFFR